MRPTGSIVADLPRWPSACAATPPVHLLRLQNSRRTGLCIHHQTDAGMLITPRKRTNFDERLKHIDNSSDYLPFRRRVQEQGVMNENGIGHLQIEE